MISNDKVTRYWQYQRENSLDKQAALDILSECNNDFDCAYEMLQYLNAPPEPTSNEEQTAQDDIDQWFPREATQPQTAKLFDDSETVVEGKAVDALVNG